MADPAVKKIDGKLYYLMYACFDRFNSLSNDNSYRTPQTMIVYQSLLKCQDVTMFTMKLGWLNQT